jgi:protein-tyrosine phosphatase
VKHLLDNLKRAIARVMGRKEPEPPAERRILFVCMGNICRSPTAEGVFRKLLAERAPELDVDVDSAGTHGYHDGHPPDPRACRAAERRGIDLKPLRARRVSPSDFERFELVLAMDEQNREFLLEASPPQYRSRIRLFLEFAPHLERREVPDPYYGGSTGFEHVLDLVEEAAAGLIEHLRRTPPPPPREPSEDGRAAD